MSTIDTSTWNPDADLNTAIEGIPLNSDAGIAQTWQALRVLMAAVKGDGDAIKAMIDVMHGATASADGKQGLVPKPEAGDQDKVLKGNGTWGTVASTNIRHSYTTAANAAKNWYRIANANTSQIDPNKPLHLQFFIRMNAATAGVGYWQSWFVDVEVCGSQSGIRIFGNNSTAPYSQARVLYENTATSVNESTRPAIDIYLNNVLVDGTIVEVEEVYNSGFDFVADGVLAVSVIPSGYEHRATAPYGDGLNNAQYAVFTSLSHITLSANTILNTSTHGRRPISCTGTITLTLPSVNSSAYWYLIKNYGAGVVTLHPASSSVYIDEVSVDITLQPSEYVLLACKSNAHYAIISDGRWKSSLETALDTMLKTKIYPVGSTFFSLTDSRNPATILGFGTWAKIEGRFLLGASSSYAADSTGGEATHTLTENEMPEHYHDSLRYKTPTAQKFGCNSGSLTDTSWRIGYTSGQARDYYVTGNTGGSQAHNNMPPYLAGYLWRRTA